MNHSTIKKKKIQERVNNSFEDKARKLETRIEK